jgi:hypothetical protein
LASSAKAVVAVVALHDLEELELEAEVELGDVELGEVLDVVLEWVAEELGVVAADGVPE